MFAYAYVWRNVHLHRYFTLDDSKHLSGKFGHDAPDLSSIPRGHQVCSKSRATFSPPHCLSDCTVNVPCGSTAPNGGLYALSGPWMRVTDVWQYLSLLLTTVFQTLCCWCGYDASDLEVLTVKMRDLRELFQWSECEPLYLYTVRKLNPHQTRWALGLARCYWCSYNMLPLSERVMDTDASPAPCWHGDEKDFKTFHSDSQVWGFRYFGHRCHVKPRHERHQTLLLSAIHCPINGPLDSPTESNLTGPHWLAHHRGITLDSPNPVDPIRDVCMSSKVSLVTGYCINMSDCSLSLRKNIFIMEFYRASDLRASSSHSHLTLPYDLNQRWFGPSKWGH